MSDVFHQGHDASYQHSACCMQLHMSLFRTIFSFSVLCWTRSSWLQGVATLKWGKDARTLLAGGVDHKLYVYEAPAST